MKMKRVRIISALLCLTMVLGLLPGIAFAADTADELTPIYTYTGGGMTFEKVSHVNTPLGKPDGVVDYAFDGKVAVHDPNGTTDLVGDRGQSYTYAAAAYGDWVYIGTMYGGLGAANIISGALAEGLGGQETALAAVNAMYNGRLYTGEPDGENAGGIFFKFNVKTGETVILLSKEKNGIIPTFRSAVEKDGKLYFVGMIQDVDLMTGKPSVMLPSYYGIDMLNEAVLYQHGLPVIYEVIPSETAEGDVLNRIYDAVGTDLDVYKAMVQANIFTSTRAIGFFGDTLIAGVMDANGPYLAASSNPSGGQETFRKIADLDDLFNYPAYKRNEATGGGGIYQVVEFNGSLYVALVSGNIDTYNEETGTFRPFAIVRGDIAEGADPTVKANWTWTAVVGDMENDRAKYTFGISPDRVSCVACTLQVYNDHLYIGDYNDVSNALQGFISNKNFTTQATNLEQSLNLYRMDKDENIEMVVGDPCELFPEGSLTGWGSGYETNMSQYHWQATVYEDKMYVSTMDTSSLLYPIVQFTNGDILEMSEEDWESQIGYIRTLIQLLQGPSGSMMSLQSSDEGYDVTTEADARALVLAAAEAAQEAKAESSVAVLEDADSDDAIELTDAQIEALVAGLLDGTITPGQLAQDAVDALMELNAALDAMAEQLKDKVTEAFADFYDELLDAMMEIPMPEELEGLYDMVLSFAKSYNIVGVVKSLPYLATAVAGFDLYQLEEMEDGSVEIQTITNDGFGDRNNHGLRIFCETDDYLAIGTANPFQGAQIWRCANTPDPVVPPADDDDDDIDVPVYRPTGIHDGKCPQDETCPIARFKDADPKAWYHDGVHYCLVEGLMNGISEDLFAPNGITSRAMIVTILWRLEGSPKAAAAADFADVADGQWYSEAIAWASENGIVEGYDNGRFGTDDKITREQMVTIMWRYAKYKGYDVSVGEDTNILSYDDAFDVSEWAIPAMQWACGAGLIEGIAEGNAMNLQPFGGTTRAQAATILYRFCETI